jgi:hypothetical protein
LAWEWQRKRPNQEDHHDQKARFTTVARVQRAACLRDV